VNFYLKGDSVFFYVTDGYVVYPQFIEDADHIVNKTYMTRVEGENTRLRHNLARIQCKNFMLLPISRNVKPIGEVGCLLSKT
jgi:IS1 family transposase